MHFNCDRTSTIESKPDVDFLPHFNVVYLTIVVSVRCAPPNGADFDGLVSTIDSGHLGALYGCEAEEAALAG